MIRRRVRTASDIWRYACPEGHRSLRIRRTKDAYYCVSCNETYEGKPRDLENE